MLTNFIGNVIIVVQALNFVVAVDCVEEWIGSLFYSYLFDDVITR